MTLPRELGNPAAAREATAGGTNAPIPFPRSRPPAPDELPEARADEPASWRIEREWLLSELTRLRVERDQLRDERDRLRAEVTDQQRRWETVRAVQEQIYERAAELGGLAQALKAAGKDGRAAPAAAGPAAMAPAGVGFSEPPAAAATQPPTAAPETGTAPAPRSRWQRPAALASRWGTRVVMGLAGLVLAVVLLFAVGPRFLPYQTYFVLTGSMEPAIPVGALIILQPVSADELVPGDIITFQRPDRPDQLVTHRIIGVEDGPNGRAFVTKGDANNAPDGWRVPARGNGWRAWLAIPGLGYLFGLLQSPLGRLLLLVVPALALGGMTLYELWWPTSSATRAV